MVWTQFEAWAGVPVRSRGRVQGPGDPDSRGGARSPDVPGGCGGCPSDPCLPRDSQGLAVDVPQNRSQPCPAHLREIQVAVPDPDFGRDGEGGLCVVVGLVLRTPMIGHIRVDECGVGVAHVLAGVPDEFMVVVLQPLVAGYVPQLREPLAQREEGRTAGTIPSLPDTLPLAVSISCPAGTWFQANRQAPASCSRYWPFAAVPGYRRTRRIRMTVWGSCVVDFGGAGHGASTTCAGRESGYRRGLFHRDCSTRIRPSTIGYKPHNSSTERKGRISKPWLLRPGQSTNPLPHHTPEDSGSAQWCGSCACQGAGTP